MNLQAYFNEIIDVLRKFSLTGRESVERAIEICKRALSDGKKILICGNGGSASDAQHFSAELVVRFRNNRRPVPAIALTTDTSILTAGANDFGYETVFMRQVSALGREGDVLIGISTSGRSKNVLLALEEGKRIGMKIIGLCGMDSREMERFCDVCIKVPSDETSHIQEVHEVCLHLLAQELENWIVEEEREK